MIEWAQTAPADLLQRLLPPSHRARPAVIGIDGRSGSGKSTVAAALATATAATEVVHTDDIAWHHSFFEWHRLLVDGLLAPMRRHGPPVSFRPPAWATHDRPGSIDIPAATTTVLVEGVGAGRRELSPWLDASIWVHTDSDLALQRCRDRNTDTDEFIDDWMAEERRFLATDRPWSRADLYVCGTASPGQTVLVARPGVDAARG